MVHAQVEARELGVGVVVHVRSLARTTGAMHRGLARQVQRAAGGIVSQLAITGTRGKEIGLDEAAHLEGGARGRARGDAGDLDRLLAGRHRRCGSALGLRSTDLHHFTLGLGDGALLLLLGGQQQLHLPLKVGHTCFQCLLSCRFGKGHARRNQRDKQRGSEWPAGRFQHVSIHWDCLSPGWRTGRTGCTVAASVRGPGGGRLFAISRKQASVRPSSNKGGSAMGGGCGTLGVSASVPRQSAFIGYKCKGEGCHD